MSGLAPYRTEALAVVRPQVEQAFCPWCSHYDSGDCSNAKTMLPCGDHRSCRAQNPDGRCGFYHPGAVTRLLRRLGRRAPMSVEVSR
jgi:hypothetical protein